MREKKLQKNFGGNINLVRIGLKAVYGFFVLIDKGSVINNIFIKLEE